MVKNFECPSCAAPLQYTGGSTQFCEYCQSTVIAPDEMRPQPMSFYQPQPQVVVDLRPYTRNAGGGVSRGAKFVIWGLVAFVLLSFLVPFIFGILGVIISILASIAEM